MELKQPPDSVRPLCDASVEIQVSGAWASGVPSMNDITALVIQEHKFLLSQKSTRQLVEMLSTGTLGGRYQRNRIEIGMRLSESFQNPLSPPFSLEVLPEFFVTSFID